MQKTFIIDSNLFAKILHPEHDSGEAKIFFKTCVKFNIKLFAPDLFKYEIAEVTRYHKGSLQKTRDLLHSFENSILSINDPNDDMWLLAEKIVDTGNPKSGFPSMYDSIYHAMAICMDSVFITADKKHFEKAKSFNHICLLDEWETMFL